jgi:O-antigen/teichoic acid export membrane protein
MGAKGVFLSTLISSAAVGLALSVWLVHAVPIGWSAGAARNLLRYGIPLVATNVATFISTFADRYFLKAVADETAVGLYNQGYLFGFALTMVGFTPVFLVWGPRRFQVANAANRDEVLSRGFLLINVLLISVAVGISLFVQDLLYVMADPEYYPAAQIVPIILIAYILQSWGGIQDIGILVSERTQFLAIATYASAGVAVIGYYFLIPQFLGWGAAYATLAAFLTRYLLTYAFSQRLMPVRYHWRPVVVLCAWGGAIAVIGYLLPPMSPLGSIPLRGVLATVFLGGVWYLPILTDEDRHSAVSVVRSVMRVIGLPLSWGAR